ncbi:MAG: hypothetical protein ACLQDF_13120 [Desulfomonilia bacterium]
MRTISISEPVWEAIADRGKFGETEDDVLRRVFLLPPADNLEKNVLPHHSGRSKPHTPRRSFATKRMSSYVSSDKLHVSFDGGHSKSWALPNQSDKMGIRTVRDEAVVFARENGASIGQINAVKKALTDSGYHLVK